MIHNPEKILFSWSQDESEGAIIVDDKEAEWVLELYSPNLAEKFLVAKNNNDQTEMNRLLDWALQHSFTDDWLDKVKLNFTLEDDKAVAALRHNPNAPIKGMRIYYTKKKYESGKFVGVEGIHDFIYFSPDETYPINVEPFKEQGGRIKYTYTELTTIDVSYWDLLFGEDYNIKEQLIPEILWQAGIVDPYMAGIVDGAWEVIILPYDLANFVNAWMPSAYYFSVEAIQIRAETIEFVKFLNELAKKQEIRQQVWGQIKVEFSDYVDDISGLDKNAQYLQGKLIFDVASLFFGVGEVKALLKGEKISVGIIQVVKALPKNVGRTVILLRKAGLTIQKVSDDLIRILNKQGDEVAQIVNKKLLLKYSTHYGGDIICHDVKTTTVLGRYIDEVNGGGTRVVKTSKVYNYGENPGGVNMLDDPKWTWEINKEWLNKAVERGDIIRLVSDPNNAKNIYIFKNGVQTDELTTFGKEMKFLKEKGYKQVGYNMVKQ